LLSAAAVVALVLFATAFAIAPHACEGGLEIYFGAGVVALVVLFALPLAMARDRRLRVRLALALGLAALGFGVWIAGFVAANVRWLCRLF
jgi:hypothetical protein